jgi:hypothetical protein
MSEEKNIEEGHKEQGTGDKKHFPEDPGLAEHAPQPQTTNDKPETPDMEVHHHSHSHGKKNWKSYFWEFLMLFLAVFCGFLAEYQLEHKIERDRARELAKSLYNEVYADSMVLQMVVFDRLLKEQSFVEFSKYVRDSSVEHPSLSFYYSFTTAFVNHRAIIFEPKEEILQQLINSGSLRYFKSNQLEKDISDLNVAIKKVKGRIEREVTFLDFDLRPFQLKYYDNHWLNQLTEYGKLTAAEALKQKDPKLISLPRILHLEKFDRSEAENIALQGLIMSSGTRKLVFNEYSEANHKLLMSLRKEYHLK